MAINKYPAMIPAILHVFEDLEVLASFPPGTYTTFTFRQGLLFGSPEEPLATPGDFSSIIAIRQ